MANALPSSLARIALKVYECIDTPLSLGLSLRLKHGEWMGISEVNPDPRQYLYAEDYDLDAKAAGFLRKYEALPTGVDKVAAAKKKWYAGEFDCYKSNQRLTRYLPEFRNSADRDRGIESFIDTVRKIILSWIGSKPDDLTVGRFGPGSTFSDRGDRITVPYKMSSDPVMTRGALWYLPQWLGTSWGAYHAKRSGKVKCVPGNRYSTVRKTALTDRSIGTEPSLNVFYQLGLGRELRRNLRRHGHWDLNKAADLHRLVAERSSLTREFATLDLSNASDTICRVLVKLLMPTRWFAALDALRSPKTRIDGKWVVLEKFSSMGNGFTFELETIIFAAISVAVTRLCGGKGWLGRDVYVFGDDIIVKNEYARPLKSCLEFFGFKLNTEKSYFGDEPFRESCGGDFMAGKPVRPYYLKEEVNEPQDLIGLANGIKKIVKAVSTHRASKPDNSPWFAVLDCLPTQVKRCRGPERLGDIVIHDEEARWDRRWRNDKRYIRVYRPHRMKVQKWDRFHPEIVLACASYGTGNRNEGVIPRDGVLSHKVGWIVDEVRSAATALSLFTRILPDGSTSTYYG